MDTSFCSKQEDYTTEQESACMVTTKFADIIETTRKSFLVFISHLLSLFTTLKLPTCSMHVLQTTFYLHQRQYLEPSMQALPSISVEPQAAATFVSM